MPHHGENVLTYLDSYCERAGDGAFWAEPINAITNLAFLIAAILAAMAIYKTRSQLLKTLDIWVLAAILAFIAVGSFLWHTAASPNTLLLDVIPILIFMNLYLIALMARIFRLRWCYIVALWLFYLAVNQLASHFLPPDTLNGSVLYAPTYATLCLLTLAAKHFAPQAFKPLLLASGIFTLSLFFRTIDLMACGLLPLGTHFIWHSLNAVLLYQLLMVLIRPLQK
jgi:hypothetical protein